MSRDANVAAQRSAVEHLNRGDVDSAMELFAVDAIDHDPAPGQSPGRAGLREFFRALAQAFPDAHFEPEYLVADDDHVCVAYTITGTHEGRFHDIPATGERIEVRGMQIGRFENAQIVERWGSSDELGLMRQIGAFRADSWTGTNAQAVPRTTYEEPSCPPALKATRSAADVDRQG